MNVAMLGWELPPHNSGGLGVACYQLCKAMASRGIDIDFILPYTAEHQIDFMKVTPAIPDGASHVLQLGNAYESFRYEFSSSDSPVEVGMMEHQEKFAESASQMIKAEVYDIIHAHDWLTFRAAVRAKAQSGLPLVVHIHSVESDRSGREHSGNPLVREIESLGLHAADRIIAVSEHTKRAIIREYHIPAEKIAVIHNSIDHESFITPFDESEFEYQYLQLLKDQGWRVVINVGRLTIQKGLDYFLKAAAKTLEHAPKTMFVFVGSGEQRDELIMKSAEYGIADHVLFAGFQRGRRWRDAFCMADLFVMPSVSEPFGLAPLEAIGYGTPVLISKQSGVAEILKNSLRVDFWDTDKMAEYMTAVVRNDSLRDELLSSSQRELLGLSWHSQVPRFTSLYQSILARGVV